MSIDAPASPSAFYQSVAPQIQAILASSTFEKDATTQNDSRSNTQSQGWQRDSHQLQRKTRDTRAVKQQKDTAADSNSRNTPAAPAPVRGTRLRPTPWKRPVVSVGKSSRPPVPGSSSPSALTETETALGPDSGTRLALSLSQTARKGRGKEGGSLGVSKRREARAAGEMQRETEELLCVNRELRSLYSQEAQEQVARRRRGSSGACRGPSSFVPGSSSREEEDAHGEADDDAAIVEGIMRGRGIEQRVLHGFLQEVISEPTTRAPYLAEALEVPRQSSQSIPEPDTGFSEHQNKLLSTRESLSLSQQKSHSADLLRDPEDSDGRMAEQQGCVTEDRKSRIQTTALRSEGLVKSRDGEDSQSDDEQNGECAVCFCGPKDTLIAPCGHVCCCLSCAREVMARGDRCPVCRAPIEDVFRVFRA
uniref:RING-type domain-containing protein n=1 Tax=Chromera velia CCMP2878 TaxID=1169474 RepID=A0A0G4FVE0_9ALVE|eukprot:Cvel_18877.t1-p1 / transcript=Cvel_18877.t1 / gene=Cvel_18877 / organism=Chromera_velia_CCMP2878 / gene_product=Probable E3 ubiquitin-protein ligase LOG2, putative / transcript_product=Probable E3 ubiquitin-protein ligase LOG2, putative / location=Cvel_scaffold1589:27659-29542(-) / protein_length=420 / sequence_SO=supercontig / SO=protein_coding / is_pseudo=false